jgi:acetate kinase
MKILVINSGSSSIKYKLFDAAADALLCSGLVERIGLEGSRVRHEVFAPAGSAQEVVRVQAVPDHQRGLALVAALLTEPGIAVIQHPEEIEAVGHRVVHGGERFSRTVVIDDAVLAVIRALIPYAPLHNPANLQGILVAQQIFEQATQVAVFDTAFHQTLPPRAYRYAIPNELYQEHGVRVYGFHGTSHLFVAGQTAAFLGKPMAETTLISAHLGNGASMAAIKNGQSMDTSLGFTPLPGLMMGTRSGDLDPAIIFYLARRLKMSIDEIDALLNKRSGLLGVAGSSDLRDVEARAAQGDANAELALEIYTYRIKKYIGAYLAALGPIDALVFTAGVGENSALVRSRSCAGLAHLGIVLDEAKNEARAPGIRAIHAPQSQVQILVIPTNEELEIARQTLAVLNAG